MTKTPASLHSDPLAALLHIAGRLASESLADFSQYPLEWVRQQLKATTEQLRQIQR